MCQSSQHSVQLQGTLHAKHANARGIWGMPPPRKILKIDALRLNLVAFLTLQYNVQLYMTSYCLRHLGMTWNIESLTNHIHGQYYTHNQSNFSHHSALNDLSVLPNFVRGISKTCLGETLVSLEVLHSWNFMP